jgi:hypothetical protein
MAIELREQLARAWRTRNMTIDHGLDLPGEHQYT